MLIQTLPLPSIILLINVFEIISVESIVETQLETSFKAETFVKAFFIWSNNLALRGWEYSKPSIHFGKLIYISSTGNS